MDRLNKIIDTIRLDLNISDSDACNILEYLIRDRFILDTRLAHILIQSSGCTDLDTACEWLASRIINFS
jgi:hypothetical protein